MARFRRLRQYCVELSAPFSRGTAYSRSSILASRSPRPALLVWRDVGRAVQSAVRSVSRPRNGSPSKLAALHRSADSRRCRGLLRSSSMRRTAAPALKWARANSRPMVLATILLLDHKLHSALGRSGVRQAVVGVRHRLSLFEATRQKAEVAGPVVLGGCMALIYLGVDSCY